MTSSRPGRAARLAPGSLISALVVSTGLLVAPAARATPASGAIPAATTAAAPAAVQVAVDRAVTAAAAEGITESISVVDRATGTPVADRGGDRQYTSESIVKLFTAAYYLVQAGGQPDEAMRRTLTAMIENSDDSIESELWNVDIVPAMAARYGLTHTTNGPKTGPHDWGWELITADDETTFLAGIAADGLVAPLVLDAMAHSAPISADGTDQAFGLNSLTGDHGSKQGWTDAGAEWSDQAQIHSVGWTDRYYVAILETSGDSTFEEMTAASTAAARAVVAAEPGAAESPGADPGPGSMPGTPPAVSATTDPSPPESPSPPDALVDIIPALRHGLDVLAADLMIVVERWAR